MSQRKKKRQRKVNEQFRKEQADQPLDRPPYHEKQATKGDRNAEEAHSIKLSCEANDFTPNY